MEIVFTGGRVLELHATFLSRPVRPFHRSVSELKQGKPAVRDTGAKRQTVHSPPPPPTLSVKAETSLNRYAVKERFEFPLTRTKLAVILGEVKHIRCFGRHFSRFNSLLLKGSGSS